jgi:hypothetical protein
MFPVTEESTSLSVKNGENGSTKEISRGEKLY